MRRLNRTRLEKLRLTLSQESWHRGKRLLVALLVLFTLSSISLGSANAVDSVAIAIRPGDTLSVSCTRPAVQRVFIHGNLSQIQFDAPAEYPASQISLVAVAPGSLDLTVNFQHPEDYIVSVTVRTTSGDLRDVEDYFLSNGEFTLDVTLSIMASQAKSSTDMRIPSTKDFSNWLVRFGEAFPLWTKVLYAFLGFQFLFVGYERILFDDQVRGSRKLRPLDLGNKIYISVDVLFKFLLTCFAITAVLMIGQVAVLALLRLIFLVNIELPSIWNLYVLAFGAVVTLSAYLLRFLLQNRFDLEPLELD